MQESILHPFFLQIVLHIIDLLKEAISFCQNFNVENKYFLAIIKPLKCLCPLLPDLEVSDSGL